MSRNVAVLLFPGVEELDFAGPWEVFSYLRHLEPEACTVFTVAQHAEVRCAKRLRVLADYGFGDAPAPDILIVPGGIGTRREVDNPELIAYLEQAAGAGAIVASVCTGAFLLERAGLLPGKRATTYWGSLDRLRALGTVEVVEERWVDCGAVLTGAGVSAGIDMSLYLIGREWSPETARRVQKGIEYFPAPPYQEVPIPA